MKVTFRTDASVDIGSGHVMRCLTLADALSRNGVEVSFICREHKGNLSKEVEKRGYKVYLMPLNNEGTILLQSYEKWLGASWEIDSNQTYDIVQSIQPDWVVVDHYGINQPWESRLKEACEHILVIDDLANQHHDCTVILNQTLGCTESVYQELTASKCKKLTGADYALLRPEFLEYRKYSLKRRENYQFKKILITLGGADQFNVTSIVLEALKKTPLPEGCQITVIMGAIAPWLEEVKGIAADMPWETEVLVNVRDIAKHMAESDFAIGAAGSTVWERCCLGLPSLTILLAENQQKIIQALNESATSITLESPLSAKFGAQLNKKLTALIPQTAELQRMVRASANLVDGNGVSKVVKLLLQEG